jgi:hypothetical protein
MSEPTEQGQQMYIINPTPEEISEGLEAWSWLPIDEKLPIAVTAFGDMFLESSEGIWFLDTLEGSFNKIASSGPELEAILKTQEGQRHFLLIGLVDRALEEGMTLDEGQCYDFKTNPILGGPIEYENMEIRDFVVSLYVSGKIHEQIKDLPPGTKIKDIEIEF